MKTYKRVRELTEAERWGLVKGSQSGSGFTVRRSHILLLSTEGWTPQRIAHHLQCGDQTVRNAVRAFETEGLECLRQKSNRPHRDNSAFDAVGRKRLEEVVHRSPRDLGFETSQWTLEKLAQACLQEGIVQQPISYETVRQGLKKLGIDWKTARQRMTSHDPHYERKKAATTVD